MSNLIAWPRIVPAGLTGLYEATADALGAGSPRVLNSFAELPRARTSGPRRDLLMVVVDAAGSHAKAADRFQQLQEIARQPDLDWVVIVGDGYLGTDAVGPDSSLAAAAVGAVRATAVRRAWSARANAVCIPDALLGRSGSPRGPLGVPVTVDDIAEAAVFLLSDSGRYVSGQVMFVDGGRHLFSSMSA